MIYLGNFFVSYYYKWGATLIGAWMIAGTLAIAFHVIRDQLFVLDRNKGFAMSTSLFIMFV